MAPPKVEFFITASWLTLRAAANRLVSSPSSLLSAVVNSSLLETIAGPVVAHSSRPNNRLSNGTAITNSVGQDMCLTGRHNWKNNVMSITYCSLPCYQRCLSRDWPANSKFCHLSWQYLFPSLSGLSPGFLSF
jgi:hypothetical protein